MSPQPEGSPETIKKRKLEAKKQREKEKKEKELEVNLKAYKKKLEVAKKEDDVNTDEEAVAHYMRILDDTVKLEVCTLSKTRRKSPGGVYPPAEESEAKAAGKSAGDQYFW